MIRKFRLLIFIVLPITITIGYAQSDSLILRNHIATLQQYEAKYPIEKTHLHLDRPWYGLGDTIWFKAYTVIGSRHQLSALSGVLYAELISPNDTVLQRLTLQLNSGTGKGEFVIPYIYKSGDYRIRSYTNWMRNDSDYFYDKKISIGGIGPQADRLALVKAKPNLSSNNQNVPESPDIQLFPEGGYLVNGLRSKVAFKAINKNGLAADIQGAIIDDNNNEVALFNTQHAGMGEFPLTPQPGRQYRAKIICTDGSSYFLDLPKAKDEGFTLTINNAADSIYVKIAANDALFNSKRDTAFYLIAQSGGQSYFTTSGRLTNHVFTTSILKNRFPSGVAQFTLFSQTGEPLNERVVFIQNNDQLKLAVTTEKESYAPLEKVTLDLATKDEEDKPVAGTFSVSVTDETKVPVDEQEETTILTDLLLTSELKGHIENPNYYFLDPDDKTRSDLDLVMLTQGYTRFEWKKILAADNSVITFKPETSLSLSGAIKTFSNKPIANGKIRLTSVKDLFSADTLSDAKGSFTFSNLYLDDTTKLVINAKKAKGGDNVKIAIKQPSYPVINKWAKTTLDYLAAETPDQVLNAMKKTYVTGQQLYLKNVIQLKEVKIKERRNEFFNPVFSDNMKFSSNLNGPGNANQVVLGDQLTLGGGGRLSDILPGKIFGLTWKGGIPYSMRATHLGGGKPMAIFVEGAQMSPNELDAINPFDIYSIEVLTSIAYLSIYGSNAPGGALIITLKHGADAVDLSKITVDGLITYRFKGFYKAREFYSPKYNIKDAARVTDDRKTIYWNPNVIADTTGKASFEYFNAGSPGTYRVVVEGIDGDGNLGRQVFRYKVE